MKQTRSAMAGRRALNPNETRTRHSQQQLVTPFMTKHYVEYFYPGIIVSETSSEEIKSRNVKIKPPKGAYAYQFFDREEVKQDGETLTGRANNKSGIFYLGGEVKTREDIEREMPGSILASNMRCNNIERVVMTKAGQAMELHEGDEVVSV